MSDATCPLCGQPESEPQQLTICGGCYRALEARDAAMVRNTGEFTVDQVMAAAQEYDAEQTAQPGEAAGPSCAWCSKSGGQVKKLISQRDVHICNECVALSVDILNAELGEDWRG